MFITVWVLYFLQEWPFIASYVSLHFLYPIWFLFASWSFNAGFFNNLYNKLFLLLLEISYISINKYLDKGLFEYFGPYGFYKLFMFIRKNLFIPTYSILFIAFMLFVIGLILLISFISWTFFWSNMLFNIGLFPIIIYILISEF